MQFKNRFLLSSENPIVRDHRVHGEHLLPGLAYIDLLYQIFRQRGHEAQRLMLCNVSIYHPLAMGRDEDVLLEVICTQSHQGFWQVVVQGQRRRNGVAGTMNRYITAEMHSVAPAVFDERIDVEQVKASATRAVALAEI